MTRKIILSGLIVSLGLLLGRLVGFVREATVASTFGVSAEADIAVLALTIPDVLVGLLVAGGLSAALIPEFTRLPEKNAQQLFLQVSAFAALFCVLLVCGLRFAIDDLTYLFAPGLSISASLSAQDILSNVLWLIPLTVMAGITTAYLQAKGKFAMPAMGTFIFNLSVVFGLVVFIDDSSNLKILVCFILLGGVLRWLSQLWLLRTSLVWRGAFTALLLHKALLYRYGQAVLALGLLTLFPVVARSFASFSGEGGIAIMNYAWRLVEFPLGLVITVLSVVLFPKLSEMYVQSDEVGFESVLSEGLMWSLLLAGVIMAPVLVSPETFVEMAYGWGGKIPSEKMIEISQLLQISIVILPFQAVIAMAIAAFNSRKDTRTPLKVSLFGFVILVPLCWWLGEKLGLIGIAMAVLASFILVSSILLYVLNRGANGQLLSVIKVPLLGGAFSYGISMVVLQFEHPLWVNFLCFALIMMLSILFIVSIVGKYRLKVLGLMARK